ncbi:MAG: hypothetical protein HRT35_23985 [Algicola sp.]|nr:hypothetical protein [Algicola sp.]
MGNDVAAVVDIAEEGFTTNTKPAIAHRLDQDIVVYWRHALGLPGSVDLVTYKPHGSDEGTFMMTVTPGDDLTPIGVVPLFSSLMAWQTLA